MNETYRKQVANFIRKNNLQTLSKVDFDNGGFYVLDKDDSLIKIPTKDLNKYLKVPIGTKIKE
ncbi:hypothetical protein SELR_25270 [Selenomonas ruminantium subsp. lactilytica TAM6421]|uniref:Uncharacterized protein n=1 Tax=Selenomonas ruminantium subsp. lactilytica (strain NBRC 103574 / TAM6421) TaxID=927704 RepID=I0GTZ8_SELRL|nr:hypothetical protein [Selenomonas ruminantium]BAL84235.1 hypothetical protein SELR_25270 [Selenomonas ruminantium subsp. lactilytica TAM6421]